MIQVENLTRAFGPTLAVDDISFQVDRGEVVCFAGKNGAGKSTTMRMLTGALGVTQGVARIGGFDVARQARQVQRIVGYLPEAPPLYLDMSVRAYLTYCARLKRAANPHDAVATVIGRTGLASVEHRLLGNLSKGYRQRVGIAQALVHDPQVLVLDEPVSGLDPEQRREVLDLVRALATERETTVILSTHVLKEVEGICDRVLIIDKGRLVAQDTVAELAGSALHVRLVVARPGLALTSALHTIDGVVAVEATDQATVVQCERDVREAIAAAAVPFGLLELRAQQTLEDAFIRLTKGAE